MEKRVLVTGASSGLGRGFVEAHLDRGDQVYGVSRRVPKDLIAKGLRHSSMDLSKFTPDLEAFRTWIQPVRRWDLVYLNAAKLGRVGDMRDTPLSDLRETMEVNVWANKWILDALFEEADSVEVVIGISTGASRSGNRGWNGYSLSKSAFNMLIKLYATEQLKTHFVALAPGLIESEMQDYLTSLPVDERFQFTKILKEARGTERMPDGRACAEMILEQWSKILAVPSGEYADIRQLRDG
ncbi:MAG: SDR family NAD(P)-dependent oxidoreductase [Verrucomicrobiota bacterium]